ncbi:MAG: hypothetical protein KDI56_17230, partial [Xanthomonadales bacterium]|nr:hypothetical protein [Xanthomonadales bacterium]
MLLRRAPHSLPGQYPRPGRSQALWWLGWLLLLPALAGALPVSGSWYDPQRAGEGLVIEVDSQGQAVLAWFTYDDAGRQRWYFGQGEMQGNQLRIDPLQWPHGSQFGDDYDPAQVQRQTIGWMQLEFASCSELSVDYAVEDRTGQLQLQRLSRPVGVDCAGLNDESALALSGSWFDVRRSGEGLLLEALDAQRAIVYWFSHDLDGGQLWLIGEGKAQGGHWVFEQLLQAVGGRFGPDFDPGQVSLIDWGSARLALDCAAGDWEYEARLEGYGSGHHVLTRLNAVAGPECRRAPPERALREQMLAFTGATLLDFDSGESATGQTLLVEQGQITGIGPTATTPVPIEAIRIGLDGAYLMPGLTDRHTHIGTSPTELLGQNHRFRQRLIE